MDWGISRTDAISDWGAKPQTSIADQDQKADAQKRFRRRTTECLELSLQYEYRRAYGESRLLEAMSPPLVEFKNGHSYNFITNGDVDSLSYIKVILLHQDLDYLLCSTWCMAAEDILQLQWWYDAGKIKKFDLYVGHLTRRTYKIEWKMITDFYDANPGVGRVVALRNHSKILAGTGKSSHSESNFQRT